MVTLLLPLKAALSAFNDSSSNL